MSLTPSNMLPLGTKAPDFKLLNVADYKMYTLNELKSDKATVIAFICNHCPFVKHIQKKFTEVANSYIAKGVSFIAINSNDVENFPDDSPDKMKELTTTLYSFPYLFDETQEVAKAYDAACTPDIYVFNGNMQCVYRGQFDDSRPGNAMEVTGKDIIRALDAVLNGEPVPSEQKPSMGCNIKWKSS